MIILGLSGAAGAGKDTVASYLQDRYGFQIFAFSDSLYREVVDAFGLESEDLLRDRATKETPTGALSLENCENPEFVRIVWDILDRSGGICLPHRIKHLSPRQVLQWWGTEYRRASDPDYWVKKTADWLAAVPRLFAYPEQCPQLFVNTTVRFPNERQWIRDSGGSVWHVFRRSVAPVNLHVSETPLEIWPGERELYNNDSLERLHYGIDLMMTSAARFVAVEPELPKEPE